MSTVQILSGVYFDRKMMRILPFLMVLATTASAVEVRYANEAATFPRRLGVCPLD